MRCVRSLPAGRVRAVVLAIGLAVTSGGAAADEPWVGNTSGPFFTGTADVEPDGSWYYEPFLFNSIAAHSFQSDALQKLAVGLPHDVELDLFAPILYNQGKAPDGAAISHFDIGDLTLQAKKQILKDADPYSLLATPSIALVGDLILPTGQYGGLSPALYGTDQGGNGTYDVALGFDLRKQAAPFQVYAQFADYVILPSDVHGPYTFNNGLTELPVGSSLRMTDGNLLYYAAAVEHVLDPDRGLGYLLEIYGETQGSGNLLFGHANAPAWSALWIAPEFEINWPTRQDFTISWGAGVALPVSQYNYPRTLIPMATATFYFNSGGSR